MRTPLRSLFLVPLATALLYACSDPTDETPADDVIYQGAVTDEALVSLESALQQSPPADVPSQAPTLDTPAAAMLPKTPIPEFTWHVGPSVSVPPALLRVPGLHGERAGHPSQPWMTASAPQPWAGFFELFGPIRSAHAHGTPYTGPATYLVFSTPANAKLVRVLTSNTTFTPSQAAWDKMASVGAPITLKLTGAIFQDNRIAQDGGPYKGTEFTFTISP
jgi:hypothetical protein